MDGVFETQPDRTDLPLVVMPVVIESMIGPFKRNFTMLENVARVRMYEDFTPLRRCHPRQARRQVLCVRRHRRRQLHQS